MDNLTAGQFSDVDEHPEGQYLSVDVEIAEEGRAVLARVEGPLDLQHAASFRDWVVPLYRDDPRQVILDLCHVDFIDSAGVRVLIALRDDLQANGGHLRLVLAPNSRADRTLSLLRLKDSFDIEECPPAP